MLHYPSGSTTADRVYGQPSFTSNTANYGGISAGSLNNPYGLRVDGAGGIYIADRNNNRVLHYPTGSFTADRVYGQLNFTSNSGGVSAVGLQSPADISLDSNGGIYVADGNARILHYPSGSTTANWVYGQPNFTSGTPNNGGLSATSLNYNVPSITADVAGGLYVADSYNNRVLHYPAFTPFAVSSAQSSLVAGANTNLSTTGGAGTGAVSYAVVAGGSYCSISGSTLTGIAAGTCTVSATKAGDNNFLAATSEPITISVSAVPQTIQFSPLSGVVYGAAPLPLTAVASSGLPVSFAATTPSVCSVSGSSVTILSAGTCSVVATQPGNNVYYAAPSVSMSFTVAKRSQVQPTADMVFGQAGRFDTEFANYGGGDSLQRPHGIALDASGGLYVADRARNRVLYYPFGNTMATRVYGQPSLNSSSRNNGGISAASLYSPSDVVVDAAGGVYIADSVNHRVLHYPPGITTADRVYGQPNFTSDIRNNGGVSAVSLYNPTGVTVDPLGGIYIVDLSNHRVLHYPPGSTTADRVYGQPGFGAGNGNNGGVSASSLYFPTRLASEPSGGIYVTDSFNYRVLHYSPGSTVADRVYGQPSFTSRTSNNGGVSATSLGSPTGVAVDAAGGIYVTDSSNNRTLHYPAGGTTADRVYGQPDFNSSIGKSSVIVLGDADGPSGVTVDAAGGLYIADATAGRVLHYPNGATTADRVYGKLSLTQSAVSAEMLYSPIAVARDESAGIYVVDQYNSRVLHYPAGISTADRVYGQPDFVSLGGGIGEAGLTLPSGVATETDGGVYVVDASRVLHYPTGSTIADRVYGQPNFFTSTQNNGGVSATSLDFPQGVAVDAWGAIYVVDRQNNRVLHYAPGVTTADRVYGQPNFTSNTANNGGVSAVSLYLPMGVVADPAGGIYISDGGNSRVLHYPPGSAVADRVYGQPGFASNASNNGGISASSLNNPFGLAVDSAGGLYIVDYYSSRVLHYPSGSTVADRVYGQPNFNSNTQNNGGISATSLNFPTGITVDADGGIYIADYGNNRIIHYSALSPMLVSSGKVSIVVGGTTTLSLSGGGGTGAVSYAVTSGASYCSIAGTTLTGIVAGTCTVAVTKAEDSNYLAATSSPITIQVSRASQSIQFSPLSGVVYGAAPLPLTALASSGLGVTFTTTTPSVCNVAGGNVTVLAAGTCTVVADQAGDGAYYAASSVAMSFTIAKRSQTLPTADMVFGQAGRFDNGLVNYTGGDSFNQPAGVLADGNGGLYVADTSNNRILHYAAGSAIPDRVYGQPNFNQGRSGVSANGLVVSANGLVAPVGLALDGAGGLYVGDTVANRVLHYPPGETTADRVYGQPNFTSSVTNNGGISATSLSNPRGLAVDTGGGVYVADAANNRVLHYPSGSTTADRVYGQPSFTSSVGNNGGVSASSLSGPSGVAVDAAGGIYVADSSNNRVLHFPAGTTTADRVYGQPSVISNQINNGGISANTLRVPYSVAVDAAGGISVGDRDNARALHYPAGSTTADRVYGQPSFTSSSSNSGGISATSLSTPYGVTLDELGGIYIADFGNSRVLHYSVGNTTADRVYGRLSLTESRLGPNTLYNPRGVATDGSGGIYVADQLNSRVLHYTSGSATADKVYGQPDFASTSGNNGGISATGLFLPRFVAVEAAGGVYIADISNNRVLHYPAGGTTADRAYGQPNFSSSSTNNGGISASSLYAPGGVAVDGPPGIYVADTSNNRVLHYPTGSTTADRVYGQPTFSANTSNNGGISAASLSAPSSVSIDATGGIYVADASNNRVLHYPFGATTADLVYGQPTFSANTSNNGGISATSLSAPSSVSIDATGGIYISDSLNNRVLHYPEGVTRADRVYGQPDFTSNTSGVSGSSLYQPSDIAVDEAGGLYISDARNNRVLHFPAVTPLGVSSGQSAIGVGGTTILSMSGGLGTGAVSYSVVSGATSCSIIGTTLTGIGVGTCTVAVTKAADNNYLEATSSTISITVTQSNQATLVAVATPSTVIFGGTVTLSTTGGSGTGAVTYQIVQGALNCTLSGATVTATAVGSCTVTATKAADANYLSATSAAITIIVTQGAQAALTAVATPSTVAYGGSATLSSIGGSGTGAVTYQVVTGGSNCAKSGTTLTATGVGTCTVTATKAADNTYAAATSAAITVTVTPANQPQATLLAIATPSTVAYGGTSTLSTAGGSGTGAVTYQVATGGGNCSISGTTLTATGVGSCTVTATKAADTNYLSATSAAITITVNAPSSVSVPNVVGLTQAQAVSALTGAGLSVRNITTTANQGVPAGSVVSSNPIVGTVLSPGSAVDLVISGPAVTNSGPSSGTGTTQTFVLTFNQSGGYTNLNVLNVLINNAVDGRQACYLAYVVSANTLYLVNDAGDGGGPFAGGMLLNGAGSISNSQCTIQGSGSSAVGSGNTLTLTLKATFTAGFSGNKILYTAARDVGGNNTGWQAVGVWGVPGNAPTGPAVGGMNPAQSSSTTQTFNFTFTDTNGWQDISVANVLINSAIDGRNACYVALVPSSATSGAVYLVDDAGNAGGPYSGISLPGSGTASNSQCSIAANGSSFSGSGNTLTVTLAITFGQNFTGNRIAYLAARNAAFVNSGWQAAGTVSR